MNYLKISCADVANGPGVRCVLWVSGCRMNCVGCHSPDTHDFTAGQRFGYAALNEIRDILSKPYIAGITLSGGHPLESENLAEIYMLCRTIRSEFPNKTIWLYTGYTLRPDQIIDEPQSTLAKVIQMCDVVVDGPYVAAERDITLKFRGSRNQRLIDIKETKLQQKIVQVEE